VVILDDLTATEIPLIEIEASGKVWPLEGFVNVIGCVYTNPSIFQTLPEGTVSKEFINLTREKSKLFWALTTMELHIKKINRIIFLILQILKTPCCVY
jgi:hypothetical protein